MIRTRIDYRKKEYVITVTSKDFDRIEQEEIFFQYLLNAKKYDTYRIDCEILDNFKVKQYFIKVESKEDKENVKEIYKIWKNLL